ncbi:MAG: tetratricopeptide repeat protein [Cyanobacteria bacterium SZAS TMP-1]|nr:tetratricopeptide repeat protein [Cyanobacteria bacterium SZAS TMP-1]
MRTTITKFLVRKLSAVALMLPLVLSSVAPVLAQDVPVPVNQLTTLRQALKSNLVKLKVQGDGINTTKLSLQVTNTSGQPIKVVIPQNEVLHPNSLSVQTMLINQDIVLSIAAGETAICTLKTVCASPKTVPPPPAAQEGLNFEVGDYKNAQLWSQIAAIIAAGKELETVGAFGTLLMPSKEAMAKLVDEEVQSEVKRRIEKYLSDNPTQNKEQAEAAVQQEMESIKILAERTVSRRERHKRAEQITQLAIWRMLGINSGKPQDSVTQSTLESDIIKELTEQIKRDKTLIAKLGGTVDKSGNFVPSDKQKQALDERTSAIFDVVDLTVRRSSEAGLTGIATLPKDDTCDTFCSVGERAFAQGDFAEAQELLSSAVAEAEKFGEADARLSRALNSLGLCYLDMTRYDVAQENLDRALKLREKVNGADSKEVAEVDNNLGLLKQLTAQYPPANQLFTTAIAIFEKTVGKTSDSVAGGLNNLGKNLCLENKADEGSASLKRALALAIINCPSDVKGNKLYTPFVAEVETNLAEAYSQMGKNDEAATLYQKALSTDVKALSGDHPFIAKILDGLAYVTGKQGQTAESETFKKQADEIRERVLGQENLELASLPLSTAAFGRLWDYVEGKKGIKASVAVVKAGSGLTMSRDTTLVNRPIKDKWALVIGISQFKDKSINLQYAAKDASDFADYLIHEANFAPDHVRLLTNEKATRTEIMSQLGDNWLPRVANPDDLVLIFFSSHGSPTNMDVGSINYLVAYDTDKTKLFATGIQLQEFADLIKKRINSQRVVLVMDACHSGAAVGAKGLFRDLGVDATQVAQGSGQMVICSSGANQSSWESARYKNGVFTHYLLEGLRKDGNKAKLATVFDFMKAKVGEEVQMDRHGARQTPALQSKWQGNDLVISVKPAEPRPGIADGDPNIPKGGIPTASSGKSVGGAATPVKPSNAKPSTAKPANAKPAVKANVPAKPKS